MCLNVYVRRGGERRGEKGGIWTLADINLVLSVLAPLPSILPETLQLIEVTAVKRVKMVNFLHGVKASGQW